MCGDVDSICEWYRRAAAEAAVAGLTRLRASALSDMADTFRDHGRMQDEERARRDLNLALRVDNLSTASDSDSEEALDSESSSGAESLDQDLLHALESEMREAEAPHRQRQPHAGALWRNNKGETHLHVACIQGKWREVERLLRSGHPVNVRDNSGWLPLHEAANFGHSGVVTLLLRHGARVNDSGGRHCGGVTPLHDAAGNGHVAVARQLLEAGADPAALGDDGKTPLHYLMHYRAQNATDLDSQQLTDLEMLENDMKEALKLKGEPIPDWPGSVVSESVSAASLEEDSERVPSPAVSEEDEQPAVAYRRAIDAVAQSAVSAPPGPRRTRRAAPAAPRPGLVTEAQYQWLEDDVQPAPAGRRHQRRLPATLPSAGSADVRRHSPPPCDGVRPVSPLLTGEAPGRPLPETDLSLSPARAPTPPVEQREAGVGATRADRRVTKRPRHGQPANPVSPGGCADGERSPASPPSKQRRSAGRAGVWSSDTLRVYVEIEGDRLLVQMPAAADTGQSCTVQWLAEQASDRYYRQFLLRPRLELLKDGALLAPEDTVHGLVSGQEDVLVSRVLDWERPPLAERYRSACAHLQQRPLEPVSARLALSQSSGRLELAELRLSAARVQPVLRAVQRYGCVTHLLLAGNPLRDAGAMRLSAALAHLGPLQTLDLTGCQLGAAGLASLASATQQPALRTCAALILGYNMFSDVSCAGELAALVTLPRLASLDLTSCQLTERHLSPSLCRALAECRLTRLRLSYNTVSGEGSELLLRALPPRWVLSLALAGWRGVAAALHHLVTREADCCLHELELRHCRLTDQHAETLARYEPYAVRRDHMGTLSPQSMNIYTVDY